VGFVLIRHQGLLDPFELVRLELFGKFDRVDLLHIEGHVAVQHEREVRTAFLPPHLDELDVLAHPRRTVLRAVREGELGAVEAKLLGDVRPRSGGVARYPLFRLATEKVVNRFAFGFAEEIP